MTAFTDLLDLRTAVVELVGRPDITDVFPRLVSLMEADLNRKLRLRRMIKTTTVNFFEGKGALPYDYLEMIGVYGPNGCEYVEQSSQRIKQGWYYYTVERLDMVAQNLSGDVTVQYYGKVPSLIEGVTQDGITPTGPIAPGPSAAFDMTRTTWVLEDFPEIYLYGVGAEAAKYIKDGELALAAQDQYRAYVSDAQAQDDRERFSRARVRVQGVTP